MGPVFIQRKPRGSKPLKKDSFSLGLAWLLIWSTNTYKSALASLDPDFPIAEWDRLLEQALLALNLLRPSNANPRLSAYASLFGQFDFSATPLAPPGTKVVIHTKPGARNSWDLNGKRAGTLVPPCNITVVCVALSRVLVRKWTVILLFSSHMISRFLKVQRMISYNRQLWTSFTFYNSSYSSSGRWDPQCITSIGKHPQWKRNDLLPARLDPMTTRTAVAAAYL